MSAENNKEKLTEDEKKELIKQLTEEERSREYNRLINIRNDMRHKYFKRMQAITDIRSLLPFNIRNLIYTTTKKFGLDDNILSDMTPLFIMNRTDKSF